MPKTIDYPRTTYISAWEVAEVVDDTGGKCAIDTAARKLNRKVSGSFKAIIGSAVKFGLLTSKREFLTTTNLFRRIKHAYDKNEERIYHREAFLHPPLFNQICRKFRNRELPVHMFDVMLVREFGVEEINAQGVAKAFIDGARMAGILDEHNVIADIDQLAAQQAPRKELASTEMPTNLFRGVSSATSASAAAGTPPTHVSTNTHSSPSQLAGFVPPVTAPSRTADAVSSLFGLDTDDLDETPFLEHPELHQEQPPVSFNSAPTQAIATSVLPEAAPPKPPVESTAATAQRNHQPATQTQPGIYSIHIQGPGIDTQLSLQETDDLDIVEVLLKQIRRRLSAS
ncbi:hypothetical protein [Hymenobacter pini]|uniref:hypothetical protein n=1 Tax=Hymenobacter pini TaxID=2880879 RepID=UPI001CF2AB5A|nr:hypothetical protein [Hymenobacter pini]MCA8830259.1 hypothetical protein [Hymenobacter pini]